MWLTKRVGVPAWLRGGAVPVTAYAIGMLAAFWFFERVAAFA